MKITAQAHIDVDGLIEAIESADPGTIDGIGADGTSTYDVTSWDVQYADGSFTIEVEVERSGGKFAPKEDVESAVLDALEGIEFLEVEGA